MSSLDDSCVQELRAKYAEDLKEMLECPVCLEKPTGHVRACKVGHHVCENCWEELEECPTCRVRLSRHDGRCFLIEELSSKLTDILSAFAPQPSLSRTIECRMGLCSSRLETAKMTDHIEDQHSLNLLEMRTHGSNQVMDIDVEYEVNKMYHYALRDDNGGLFFLVIFIDDMGSMFVEIQVAHSNPCRYKYRVCLSGPFRYREDFRGTCALGDEKGSHVHEAKIQRHRRIRRDLLLEILIKKE